jgi:hypothetical protein
MGELGKKEKGRRAEGDFSFPPKETEGHPLGQGENRVDEGVVTIP